MPFTPRSGSPIAAVTPARTAAATPGVRTENGLQIQDVQFRARITAPGGLRIRDKPDTSGAVVASVAEGATVDVEGKVLNGAEGESGKGTVWYIVGMNRYVYGAEGYVTPIGTPTPR